MTTKDNLPRNYDGTLQAYAWPGGYPIYYLAADNGVLCPACANENIVLHELADPECPDDDQWRIVAAGVHWEGEPIVCENCNEGIDSAYGPPEGQIDEPTQYDHGPTRQLECCCCGQHAPGRQWWNRDTGYGLCDACISFCGVADIPAGEEVSAYGIRGVHWDVLKQPTAGE